MGDESRYDEDKWSGGDGEGVMEKNQMEMRGDV